MQRSTALLLIALTALLGAAFAGARTIDANASVYEGVTRPAHTYRLAAPVDEIVGEVLVEPGDVVETGQTLVRLRDAEARLAVELLELRAGSTLGADAAKAAWEVSALEAEASREAMDAGAVLEPEMRRVALRAQRDRLIYEQTLQERDELAIQLRRARATLERYTLTAPAPGVVVSEIGRASCRERV
jgi:multidrug efflux pump subunit AcrA (membrane-fusion protein)